MTCIDFLCGRKISATSTSDISAANGINSSQQTIEADFGHLCAERDIKKVAES